MNDRFFAIGVLPLAGKVIQRGIFFEQCFAGVIFKGFGNQFTVGVVILNALCNNAHRYTVDVKLADFLLVFFRKWADIIGIGNLVWWRRRFINACYLFFVMFADFFEFLFKIRFWIGDILWCGIHDFFGNAIETLIGKQFGGFFKVEDGKPEFAVTFVDACTTTDNLLEFGHRLDVLVQYYQFAGFSIHTSGHQL